MNALPFGIPTPALLNRTRRTILCPVGFGQDRFSADYTAFLGLGMEDGCFQRRVIGQHRIAEPLTVQRVGNPLWADIAERPVQNKAASIVIIAAAAAYQLPRPLELLVIHPG